ncbi:protein kinase domain-containing protein [Streptomyces sp. ODS05-4]|uniref:serine/threonine-protein kinase n=1 Tax=Streptomyces sp. ODS05-4 TaxID=2944939 RepID=UPI00387E7F9C
MSAEKPAPASAGKSGKLVKGGAPAVRAEQAPAAGQPASEAGKPAPGVEKPASGDESASDAEPAAAEKPAPEADAKSTAVDDAQPAAPGDAASGAVTDAKSGTAGKSAGPATGSGGRASGGRGAGGGRLLAGRYRLDGVLGRGGMGTVWRAVDETLGRTVAVKELRFPNSIDDEEKRRLITRTLREAKAIARIRNNGAVTVYDVVDEDDRPWIVMELIEGKSLADAVREDGVLTPKRAAEVGLAILDVLRSAHREGILHRDVKPSNVLIGGDGRVVLTDFGIAQVEGDPSITSTGMLVGAPSYISPERARGHKPGPAADMWSLGGLLYASTEGCPPYDKGSAIATLTAVMTEQLDPPKNAGPLTEVIYGLLEKDPAKRLDDAGARALLQKVVRMREKPPVEESSPEATRVVPLPPVPPAPLEKREKRPRGGDRAGQAGAPAERVAPPATEAAAERMRGALRSVRNAAAAAAANRQSADARSRTARGGAGAGAAVRSDGTGRGPAAPPRAPLTDVVPRRTLVIIAVVLVLVIVAVVLAVVFSGGGDDQTQGKPGAERTASAGADVTPGGSGQDGKGGQPGTDPSGASGSGAPSDGGSPGQGGQDGDGQSGEDGDGQGEGDGGKPSAKPGGGGALPAGYTTVTNDRFRFSMAMPSDFSLKGIAGTNSGGKFWGGTPYPRVQIDFTGSPRADAALAWTLARTGVADTSSNYRHIGIAKVDYNGYPSTADWQFERDENGERVRVLNRGFKVDAKRGYSIMVSCPAAEWDGAECRTLRDTAFATFAPKG